VRLDAAMSTQTFAVLVALYCSRAEEPGRQRALLRLHKVVDPFAQFEIARLHRPAAALWSSAVAAETGAIVSEHALVRFFERSGAAADLDAALIEGNRECARGRFHRLAEGTETIVRAGPGCFCGIVEPDDAGAGVMTARTWLHRDQWGEGAGAPPCCDGGVVKNAPLGRSLRGGGSSDCKAVRSASL
jgi:hypothetical protein